METELETTVDSSLTTSFSDYTSFSSITDDDGDANISSDSFGEGAADADSNPAVQERCEPTAPDSEPMNQPLYDGTDITVWDSYMLLMQHSLRHCLTRQAFSDLLKVVGMLLPSKSMVSYYKLRKYFLDLYADIIFTPRYCHSPLQTKEAACANGCIPTTSEEFLTVSVAAQLRRKLQGKIVSYMT